MLLSVFMFPSESHLKEGKGVQCLKTGGLEKKSLYKKQILLPNFKIKQEQRAKGGSKMQIGFAKTLFIILQMTSA